MYAWFATVLALVGCAACGARTPNPAAVHYDVVIRGGTVYDGRGGPPIVADVGIVGDRIAAIGPLGNTIATTEVDARGLAVAPGFINMLSWAGESLIADGRSQSDIRQGVTLEVMGEGWSMGPLDEALRKELIEQQADIKYDVTWTTLGEYLAMMEKRGIATNIASFVGASTIRIHELGHDNREPTTAELERMRALVRQAMQEGALGVGSSLIYAPAFFAKTSELIELCKVASQYGGMYITHMRSEGGRVLEAIDEVIEIARAAHIPAEIYHFKMNGRANWSKVEPAIAKIEAARKAGVQLTANMYTYTAASTQLSATMPPWTQEGGHAAWIARLEDPATRERIAREMTTPSDAWDNFYLGAGPEGILLVGFKSAALKPLTGKTLAEVAKQRGKPAPEVIMDLVVEDDYDIGANYFTMSEDNVTRQLRLPWVSFGSDAESSAPEGVFLQSSTHPRAYGNVARWLGRYVRDQKLVPLTEAIRRLTSQPAQNLRLVDRGVLAPRYFADVVVFDPATITDHATFEKPMQYATGVLHVFVNGVSVLANGEHTGKLPGRAVRGPGYRKP